MGRRINAVEVLKGNAGNSNCFLDLSLNVPSWASVHTLGKWSTF